MPNRIYQKIRNSVHTVREHSPLVPELGIVIGSGLETLLEHVTSPVVIPYSDIPHFHGVSVEGTSGKLILGTFFGTPTAFLHGRLHLYEGYPMEDVVFPTRVLCALGIQTLLIANAAGGVNPGYVPGDLMVTEDHLNLMGDNPLKGPHLSQFGSHYPDLTEIYNSECIETIKAAAHELNTPIHTGVYAALLGPTYETPAEVRMLRTLGADAVGMSTVPEAIAASHFGVRVIAISMITNRAAGLSKNKLSHAEVVSTARKSAGKISKLLEIAVPRLRIGNTPLSQKPTQAQPEPLV